MTGGWSRGHELEDQKLERQQTSQAFLKMLEISQEQYIEMETLAHFTDIVYLAAMRKISFYSAESLFYEEQGQDGDQLVTEPTGQVYTYNPQNSFAGERREFRKYWKEAK